MSHVKSHASHISPPKRSEADLVIMNDIVIVTIIVESTTYETGTCISSTIVLWSFDSQAPVQSVILVRPLRLNSAY